MKRKISLLLVLSMLVTPLAGQRAQAESSDRNAITAENAVAIETELSYEAEFTVTGSWEGHYNATITLENTGESTIDNWHLGFESSDCLESVWNGQLYEPENYTLPVGKIEVPKGEYTTDFVVENSWDSAFSEAEITMTNLTDQPLEDWILEFDFEGDITLLWDGEIINREGNRYTVRHVVNNPVIPAGGEVTFGFNGSVNETVSGNTAAMTEPAGIILYRMGYDPDALPNGNESQGETVSGDDVSGNIPAKDLDSDGDGIADLTELALGFDPYAADSDGDEMPDGYELYTLYPLLLQKGYEEERGILPEDDYDGDGLTNLEEYRADTNPGNEDTDGDGLTDYDEIHIHETGPGNSDTDSDGLNDGLEVSKGLDPLITDSDGNGIPDGEEILSQTLTVEETDKRPLSEAGVIPTLTITGKGDYSGQITILDISRNGMFERTGFVVGNTYDFYHPEEVSFEHAELTFAVSEEVLAENNLVDLAVAWYDEKNGVFEVLDTAYDKENGTVTATPGHFSCFTVVNTKKLYAGMIRAQVGNNSLEEERTDTGINSPDVETFNGHRYLLADKSMSWTEAQAYCNELGGYPVIVNNKEEQEYLIGLMARKGTKNTYYIGLSGYDNQYSWVDGTSLSYRNWAPGEPNNVHENVVHMYAKDWGMAQTGEWNDTYNNTGFGGGFFWDAAYTGFICEFDHGTDSCYIVLSDGTCVLLDADPDRGDMSVDTDGDGVPDLLELGSKTTQYIPKYYGAYYDTAETTAVTTWTYRSNPAAADTDGDGFPDNNDIAPKTYDVAVEQVVGGTGGAGTVVRLNTGAVWRVSGMKSINDFYEQYYTRIANPGSKESLETIKRMLDANRENAFTVTETATFQLIDLQGVIDYMQDKDFAFKKQVLSEVRGEKCTDEAVRSAYSILSWGSAWADYLRVSWNQIIRGKFAEETNLLGTIGEVGIAFVGLDFFQDARDLCHDVIFWEDTPQHKFETAIDGVGVVPVVGVLAVGDEI
ncbi:MAG: cellulose binding domain-containing protein, partial [Lachnospiraceae bacterium]|nr:cellulose binding domain-containing protein [Lachnospiraceae bacterium]